MQPTMKLKLTCEECGVIGEVVGGGTRDAMNATAEDLIQAHWEDVHPYPSVRFNWEDRPLLIDGDPHA